MERVRALGLSTPGVDSFSKVFSFFVDDGVTAITLVMLFISFLTLFGDGVIAGDLVAGDLVAGDLVAGDLVAGDLVAGDLVAGDLVAGDLVAVDLVVGDLAAEDLVTRVVSPSLSVTVSLAAVTSSFPLMIWQ